MPHTGRSYFTERGQRCGGLGQGGAPPQFPKNLGRSCHPSCKRGSIVGLSFVRLGQFQPTFRKPKPLLLVERSDRQSSLLGTIGGPPTVFIGLAHGLFRRGLKRAGRRPARSCAHRLCGVPASQQRRTTAGRFQETGPAQRQNLRCGCCRYIPGRICVVGCCVHTALLIAVQAGSAHSSLSHRRPGQSRGR